MTSVRSWKTRGPLYSHGFLFFPSLFQSLLKLHYDLSHNKALMSTEALAFHLVFFMNQMNHRIAAFTVKKTVTQLTLHPQKVR